MVLACLGAVATIVSRRWMACELLSTLASSEDTEVRIGFMSNLILRCGVVGAQGVAAAHPDYVGGACGRDRGEVFPLYALS